MFINVLESWKWQLGFQHSTTAICDGIQYVYNYVYIFLIFIFFFLFILIWMILERFYWAPKQEYRRNLKQQYTLFYNLSVIKANHNTLLEFIWTLFPIIILTLIAIPSFILLYSMDEIVEPAITLKVIGHQWYWEYDNNTIWGDIQNYESWIIPTSDLELGDLRLLEVDTAPKLPIKTHIRILVTSADVLHAWTIPSIGVKIDAVPGRLNQGTAFFHTTGIHYGQCSEICGVNHGFMPIKLITTIE